MDKVKARFISSREFTLDGIETKFEVLETFDTKIYNMGYTPYDRFVDDVRARTFVTIEVPLQRCRREDEGPSGNGKYYVRKLMTFELNVEIQLFV